MLVTRRKERKSNLLLPEMQTSSQTQWWSRSGEDSPQILNRNFFLNFMWSVLPMRPKARVLALISVIPKLLLYVLFTSSWNCQMLAAEQLLAGQAALVALPSAHHGKNPTYWAAILQLSWSGRQSRPTLQLSASFVCPPLKYSIVNSNLCDTQMPNLFCCHLIWVLPSTPPQLIQLQWLPFSFSLTHRAGTCLHTFTCQQGGGGGVDQIR